MTTINERVNQVRRQHGLTQQKFAEMLGISQSHLSGVENRNYYPSVPVLKLIAAKFGVNEQWLRTGKGSPAVPAVPSTTVGQRIRTLRAASNLTQMALAEQTGIPIRTLINYENSTREPNAKNMAILERFFQISGDDLRGESDKCSTVTRVTIGQRLGELRREKGLTQKALAQEFGISLSSLINYENNQRFPVSGVLTLFRKYFNVSYEYLIGESNDRSPAVRAVPAQSGKEQTAVQLMAKIDEFRAMSAAIGKRLEK